MKRLLVKMIKAEMWPQVDTGSFVKTHKPSIFVITALTINPLYVKADLRKLRISCCPVDNKNRIRDTYNVRDNWGQFSVQMRSN